MSNEIKTLPLEEPVKKPDDLPVLFVDKRLFPKRNSRKQIGMR